VARDGAPSRRRGSGEGSLHGCTHPSQHTENSGNELGDLLQSQGLTPNDPSKRTGSFAQNEPPSDTNQTEEPARQHDPALSREERVARDGALSSRRGSGEGSLHGCIYPRQYTENSGNELHDLLQSQSLTQNEPSKRTGLLPQNEPLVSGSIAAHGCASGNRGASRRPLNVSDRRVCGLRFFVQGGNRGRRMSAGLQGVDLGQGSVASPSVQHHPGARSATPPHLRRGIPGVRQSRRPTSLSA
jgi:hypothetical protein